MNSKFWHRQWIRALQALLAVLCTGIAAVSLAAGHAHCDEQSRMQAGSPPVALESTVPTTPPIHAQRGFPNASDEMAFAMNDMDHRGHGAHGDCRSSMTNFMPCDGAIPCSSACALACAAGGLIVTAFLTNVNVPLDWGLMRVPLHDDVDAIVEVTLPALYRPPIS